MTGEERQGWSEDATANAVGVWLLTACVALACWLGIDQLSARVAPPAKWGARPLPSAIGYLPAAGATGLALGASFAVAAWLNGKPLGRFLIAFAAIAAVACVAQLIAAQQNVKAWGLEYALWCIALGIIAGNLSPARWWSAAGRSELFLKTGLVLLGAEVLLGQLLALGLPGVMISWLVTPIVLVTTFWFGQRVLRIESPSLNMVVSADMSVCGVSAAIATASACRAKREELSLAIALSLAFTMVTMVAMPPIITWLGLGPVIGGAWIGGTIDSTGAVAVAGSVLGETALVVATTVKMVQNLLIGAVALAVGAYWAARYPTHGDDARDRPGLIAAAAASFPRFLLGFLGASLAFSTIASWDAASAEFIDYLVGGVTSKLRTACFAMAFVAIGLETDFAELRSSLRGGKPLALYVVGQTLNLMLSLAMCLLVFRVLFPDAADALLSSR
jgi:uncharacterized integral membrane protein (TIGR00698 family)